MRRLLIPALVIVLFVLSMGTGGSDVGFQDLLEWLSGTPADPTTASVFRELRIPRTLTALFVGGALALAGLFLQYLLDNPLAEPYTLGLSGGASVGAVLPILIGLQPLSFWQPTFSLLGCLFIGAGLAVLVLKKILRSPRTLVLTGLMLSLFCGSLVVLAMSLFEPSELYRSLQWLMGFCGTDRDIWWPTTGAGVVLALAWAAARRKSIDRLLLSEDLLAGFQLGSLRFEILVVTAILTALATAQMGLVGFVGVMGPQLAFLVLKSRRLHLVLLPTLASGGGLVLLADVLGRWLGGYREVPAGSLVALLGAPFMVFLLVRRTRHVEN